MSDPKKRPSLTGWSRKVAPTSVEEFLDAGQLHQPALGAVPDSPVNAAPPGPPPVVKTLLGVRIPRELHRRLKRAAMDTERRMEDIVAEALAQKLDTIEDRRRVK